MSLENTKIVQKSGRAGESVTRMSCSHQRLSKAERGTEDESRSEIGNQFP